MGLATVPGIEDDRAAVADRGADDDVRGTLAEADLIVHRLGELVRLLRGQVAPDAAVRDRPPLAQRGEVAAQREVPVAEAQPDAQRLQRPAPGVIAQRIVAEDGHHGDVGLRGDPFPDGDHGPLAALIGQTVEVRRGRRLERGHVPERRRGTVAKPIEDHIQDLLHRAASRVSTNVGPSTPS